MVVVVWRWSWCVWERGFGGVRGSPRHDHAGYFVVGVREDALRATAQVVQIPAISRVSPAERCSRALGATSPAPLDGTAPPTRGKPEPYSSVSRSEPYSTSTGCAGVVTMFQNCHST